MRFADRTDGGRRLADALAGRHLPDPVVLALPRGGVPVGAEVADRLGVPLDVLVVRKIGAPGRPELGVGALAEDAEPVWDDEGLAVLGLDRADLAETVAAERRELRRRLDRYRRGRPPVPVQGRTAVVVDDGLATGGTALAAVRAVRGRGPARVVLAVPVGAPQAVTRLVREADEVVCPLVPERFTAVGLWYERFGQTSDEEVEALLAAARARHVAERGDGAAGGDGAPRAREAVSGPIRLDAGDVALDGDLDVPSGARGLVAFAHGSGSTRHSPRNQAVAGRLRAAGLGTLLFDLLTPAEAREDARTAALRFDVARLGDRCAAVGRQLRDLPATRDLPLGWFGASTGAAAALLAAAADPEGVRAVVSRGGRPDLAGAALPRVRAPTLLIVGSRDEQVLALNRAAAAQMAAAPTRLAVVEGATHLFEEPGALDAVADLAARWFAEHLGATP